MADNKLWRADLVPGCWLITSENGARHIAEVRTAEQVLGGKEDGGKDTVDRIVRACNSHDALLEAVKRVEQTIRNLGYGELTGDAREIALNEAANLCAAIAKAEA